MEQSTKFVRPRSLSDIPETEHGSYLETSKQQQDISANDSLSGRPVFLASIKLSQPRSANNSSKRLLPRKNADSSFSDSLRVLATLYKPAMASPSGSAPVSSRVELPVLHTSPPSPTIQSRGVSPAPAIRAYSASDLRPTSPSANRRGRARYRSASRPPVQASTMNLKQLTCHWWYQTGSCRFSSKDCLYAHQDTGKYAEAPRQVFPGQPAVAGRNADRKIREVENHLTSLRLDDARKMHSRSSSSLADITNHPFSAPPGGAFNISRPSTPGGLMLRSPAASMHAAFPIIPNSPLHFATNSAAQLEGEVKFFRTLVEQGGKEKEVMVSTIESLQAENQTLKAESSSNKADNKRLTEERDALRGALSLLQQQSEQRDSASNPMSRSSTPISTLRRTTPGSSSFADFGAIGAKRFASGGGAA